MRTARRAARPLGIAVTAALVAGGVVLAGAGTAAAADPPANRIAVASWFDHEQFDLITEDAVYIHEVVEDVSDDIFRLAYTRDATGTTVEAPRYMGSAAPYSKYAEHEGTLAYIRASDDALVVQAADGSSMVQTWAETADFTEGVHRLTQNWIVGGPSWAPIVYDLQTGTVLDLLAMSNLPPSSDCATVQHVAITDERVAWVASCSMFPPGYVELLTVALDADGPAGPVTSLGRVLRDTADFSTPFTMPSLVGSTLLWQQITTSMPYSTATLKWRTAAPYDAAPATLTLPSLTRVSDAGDQVVLSTAGHLDDAYGTPTFSATWRPATSPTTTVASTGTLVGGFEQAAGPLYVYSTGEGYTSWLTDVSGRPVRASGWIPPITFTDVMPGDAFSTEIMWLAREGLTTGYTDGTFRRVGTVNRDAMAAFLYRITHDGGDAPDCTAPAFVDVPASHPFCGEIDWLAETGITTGWSDGTFRPGQPVTREAMAAFLFRLHRMYNPSTPVATCASAPFADVATSHPFCGAIRWLADSGVSAGWPDGTFRPGTFVERQAMAAFLYRFIDKDLLFPPI